MRVALLVTDLKRGGTPLRIVRTAEALRDAGVQMHVGCLAPPGPLTESLSRMDIPTFACSARSARNIGAISRLVRALRKIQPDLVHSTLTHANVAARLAGMRLSIPVVGSTATIEVERRWHVWVERATAWCDAAHVVGSRALADHVVRRFGLPPGRVHVTPPLIRSPSAPPPRDAARERLGLAPNEFAVAWIGRFDRVKRIELLIDAIAALPDIPARLLLAGEGPLRSMLEAHASRVAPGRVQLLGWCDDPSELLSAADVLACVSRTEGVPNAVLEAMARGVPVVGADIAALRELAGDDARAPRLQIVHDVDSAGVAAALRRVHANRADRSAMAQRARAWIEREFAPDNAIARLLRVYASVLAQVASK